MPLRETLPRYRFGEFVLSPRRRILLRAGRELPLIPRYFDLLTFLVARRHDAVRRRDIFEHVWTDVIVSDSALSQAIRTLRRTLGDDPREPTYIRTVSRHGYRFVFPDVVEESDDELPRAIAMSQPGSPGVTETRDAVDALVQRLLDPPSTIAEEEQRDAAERLHVLGTDDALRRLTGPRAAYARALLRDTRWNVPGAGPVPLIGESGGLAAAVALIRLRLRRASRVLAARSVTAAIGGGGAGIAGGTVGGLLLSAAPGSEAPAALAAVLAIVGGCCGALGGAGVGAGLSIGEAIARSRRLLVLAAGAAFGGGVVGESTGWLARVALASIVGVHVAIGGGVQGLVLGGAAGFGYALATRYAEAGLAAPRGRLRLRAAALTALACALAAVALTAVGLPLVGGTIHTIAVASAGSQAVLTPIGRLIGEPDFGAAARALIAMGEAALFGFGLALGLTRRPPTPGDAA